MRVPDHFKKALFAAVSIPAFSLTCCVFAEGVLRLIKPRAVNEYRAETESLLAKKVGWGGEMDAHGKYLCDFPHAASKPKNKLRILLLGDSILDCNETNQRFQDTIPSLLQGYLGGNYEVINLAAGGWGNDQQLLAYEEVGRKYEPDMVFLFFTPANDLFNNSSGRAISAEKEKPYFQLGFGGRLELHEPKVRNAAASWPRRLFSRSEIKKRLILLRNSRNWVRLFPLGIESEAYSQISAFINPLPSRLNTSWTVTQAIFTRLDEDTRRDKARFALVYVPSGIRGPCEFPKEFPDKCAGYGRPDISVRCERKNYRVDSYQPFNLLREFSKRSKIPLISNLEDVEPFRANHQALAPDCLHLNRHGSDLLARKVADHVQALSRTTRFPGKYK